MIPFGVLAQQQYGVGGPPIPANPVLDIPGLTVLLDSADPGDLDNTWSDLSGNSNHFVASAGNLPAVSTEGFYFPNDVNKAVYGPNLSAYTAGELFVKAKNDPAYSNGGGFGFGNDQGLGDHHPYSSGFYSSFGNATRRTCGGGATAASVWHIANWWSAPSDWRFNINGAQVYATGSNTVSFPSTSIVGKSNPGGNYWGWVKAVVLFNRKLTTEERTSVEDWLDTL